MTDNPFTLFDSKFESDPFTLSCDDTSSEKSFVSSLGLPVDFQEMQRTREQHVQLMTRIDNLEQEKTTLSQSLNRLQENLTLVEIAHQMEMLKRRRLENDKAGLRQEILHLREGKDFPAHNLQQELVPEESRAMVEADIGRKLGNETCAELVGEYELLPEKQKEEIFVKWNSISLKVRGVKPREDIADELKQSVASKPELLPRLMKGVFQILLEKKKHKENSVRFLWCCICQEKAAPIPPQGSQNPFSHQKMHKKEGQYICPSLSGVGQ